MRGKYAVFLLSLTLITSVATLFMIYPPWIKRDFCDLCSWAYQLQDADPDYIALSGFDLVVIDYSRDGTDSQRYTRAEIEKIISSGTIPIAYISIGEAEDYRFYWREDWRVDPPEWLGKENPDWEGNYAVKYWYSEWKQIIFQYIDKIISQGFKGLYLDRVDEFEYWSDPNNGEDIHLSERDAAKRMINFIVEISQYCKERVGEDFLIIPQNGERLLKYDKGRLLDHIDGWGVEDLFYNETTPINQTIVKERIMYLERVKDAGKFILSVDYVDDGSGYRGENMERINDYIEKARKRGYIPYAARSDRMLDELNIIKGVQPKDRWEIIDDETNPWRWILMRLNYLKKQLLLREVRIPVR